MIKSLSIKWFILIAFYVILLLKCCELMQSPTKSAPIQIRFYQRTIDHIKDWILKLSLDQLHHVAPNLILEGERDLSLVDFHYRFSRFRFSEIHISSSSALLVVNRGVQVRVNGMSTRVDADWEITIRNIFFSRSYSGSLRLDANFQLQSLYSLRNKTHAELSECSLIFNRLDVTFFGQSLLTAVFNSASSILKTFYRDYLSRLACEKLKKALFKIGLDFNGFIYADASETEPNDNRYKLGMEAVEIKESFADLKFGVKFNQLKSCLLNTPIPLPAASGLMGGVGLSLDLFYQMIRLNETASGIIDQHRQEWSLLTSDDVIDRGWLNMSCSSPRCFSFLFPEVSREFSGGSYQISYSSTEVPYAKLNANNLHVRAVINTTLTAISHDRLTTMDIARVRMGLLQTYEVHIDSKQQFGTRLNNIEVELYKIESSIKGSEIDTFRYIIQQGIGILLDKVIQEKLKSYLLNFSDVKLTKVELSTDGSFVFFMGNFRFF